MNLSRRLLNRLAATTLAAAALATALPALAADPKVKFVTTDGDFVVELYPDKAPKTVANFLQYVKDKHYDGTIFHRVIKNFMVQGGGFDADYKEKPTRASVIHEGRQALAKGLKNVRGTLAMARTSDPQSAKATHQVDGLAGATLTSKGVNNLLHFWLGENGFGPLLANLKKGEA